ncbi:MAG: hypothetical protein ACI9OJ_005621 [Myxococcota bacterium]|jgi:hypothetical protein
MAYDEVWHNPCDVWMAANANWRPIMKNFELTTIFTILAATVALSGCAADGDTSTSGSDEVAVANFNLEMEDGGFEETSELAAFDDYADDAFEVEGPAVDEPEVDAAIAGYGDDAARYEIRVLWGQRSLTADTPPTNWDGAVSTSRGALRVVRTIRFETNDNLLPRTSPQSVEFVSTTGPHHDGLRLRLMVPRSPAVDAAGSISIALGSLPVITIPHERLTHLVNARKVDDLGNGVSIVAFRHRDCARGMVAGHWRRLNARGGVMAGKVVSKSGETEGRLRGIWGTRKDGSRRFFGVMTRDGKPAGVVRGTWRAFPNRDGGLFRGHWVNAGKHQGVLTGAYGVGPIAGRGHFHGVYVERCSPGNDAPEMTTDVGTELCSEDGVCVAEPVMECIEDECIDITDLN